MVLNIIPDEVSDMVARDECVIIDVREPFEYEAGHIEGSILAPMYDIFNDISIVKKYEGKKIVLVCSSGHRSYYTGKFLEENGIENVYNLYNGLYGWEIEEKPLV
ncbi:rhodanese-like domain-containing protein [Ferroplasma sp.]|uniref:rhodanese-like domain-containing protein n=1 Tax=Ferroplasma sp. TaxID=2591003 RepID=UPI00262A9CB2|nr:rhodanese-like domain-containing protein [Ferroplasma sp.]MCL4453101.1 rhodanese-like domain-containing protein [Candidatus Thermoplasmatota archaeon]